MADPDTGLPNGTARQTPTLGAYPATEEEAWILKASPRLDSYSVCRLRSRGTRSSESRIDSDSAYDPTSHSD